MSSHSTKVSLVLLFPVLLAGCYDADRHDEHASFDEAIQSVRVDVGSGDVTLRGGDLAGANVAARVQGDSNHLGHTLSDGHLALFDECNEHQCSVDITADIPSGVPVEIHTGSGDLVLSDLLAPVALHTGSGDIDGGDLAGTDLVATTGSGDVRLDVETPAERVHIRTGSGDVVLNMPGGTYDLRVETGSGDQSYRGVIDDADAAGIVEITTGSGDVTVRGL